MAELWMFVGALVAVYLVPGPDMVLVLQTSSSQGRGHALATALGLAAARAMHVALAALGLAALLKTVPWAFDAVRVIGAAYLVWLGVRMARATPWAVPIGASPPADPAGARRAAIWRGVLTNGTNPKALLFCSVLLPQFVHADHGNVAGQFLLLGAILVALGFVFDAWYAMAGAALGYWMARHPVLARIQRWAFATLLVGFGIRLVLAERPH
jgi:threonine/homoserine/homoserine lactone efflux protein